VKLQPKAIWMRSTDEVHGSLAYDSALLIRCCTFPFALAGLFLLVYGMSNTSYITHTF